MENENILELTKENLIKYGFDSDTINKVLSDANITGSIKNESETFVASIIDNKIYTILEAHRKVYFKNKLEPEFPVHCLGLIKEYYELAETNFLKARKKQLTLIYDEEEQKKEFKKDELRHCIDAIDWHFNQPISNPIRPRPHPLIAGKQAYKVWLEKEQQSKPKAQFTAFQWAIVFYYDFMYSKKEPITKKGAIKLFIAKHNVTTTHNRISNDEIIINNTIENNKIDTKKLNSVKLFIKDNYNQSVFDAIEFDITMVNDEKSRK